MNELFGDLSALIKRNVNMKLLPAIDSFRGLTSAEIEVLADRRTFRLRCASHAEAVGWIRVIGIPEEGVPDAPAAEAGGGAAGD